jgi:hypothetical protein
MKKFLAGLLGGVAVVAVCLYALRIVGEARPGVFQSVSVDGAGNLVMIEYPDFHITKAAAADGYATRETIRTDAFTNPVCAGIDGDGNLFITDQKGDAIKELMAADDYRVSKTLATGVVRTGPFCNLALDGSGNIFLFEPEAVTEVLAEGGYATAKPLAHGHFGSRHGGALDTQGNIFVLDDGAVKEITVDSGYTEVRTIANNVYTVNGSLTVDAVGNIFVANDEAVKELPAEGGYAQIKTLTNKRYFFPNGTAVDRDGNLIVVDFPVRRVDEVIARGGYSEAKPLVAVDDSLAYRAKMLLPNKLTGPSAVTVVARPLTERYSGPPTVVVAPPQVNVAVRLTMPNPELARKAATKANSAISACVAERLRGELPSRVSSADCSAPGILAAYQEVDYPYMDLIKDWVDERRDFSSRLDQHLITDQQAGIEQKEFMRKIEETAQKRRNGVSP